SQSFRLLFNYLGMTQLMAGGGVVLIGTQLIPLLGNLFS
ncbi:Maff2 family mobile element protein, partial [Parablautia intestinalis]